MQTEQATCPYHASGEAIAIATITIMIKSWHNNLTMRTIDAPIILLMPISLVLLTAANETLNGKAILNSYSKDTLVRQSIKKVWQL